MNRFLLLLALAACAPSSHGFWHLWTMTELYSNADGSVQFLEMAALAGSQQFLAGHELATRSGSVTRRFTFPADLPGDSTGARMIIGTRAMAARGIQPDYIVPDGFFFRDGGSIDFLGADEWNHGPLPTDGVLSLQRDGSRRANSPTNFAGVTASITAAAAAALNVHGLWWSDPDDSEPGWGLTIAQHGAALFVSWYTYDRDGSPLWLFMSNAMPSIGASYRGELYRATGSPFASYDPARLVVIPIGSATLEFTTAERGTFIYQLEGVSRSRPIKRFNFASPRPTCDQSGAVATNFTDLWWRAPAESERGWGLTVAHQGETAFVAWFTYGADGRATWFYGPSLVRGGSGSFSGELFRATGPSFDSASWNRALVLPVRVGNATLAFAAPTQGVFSYTVDGLAQSKPITRNQFALPPTACR